MSLLESLKIIAGGQEQSKRFSDNFRSFLAFLYLESHPDAQIPIQNAHKDP